MVALSLSKIVEKRRKKMKKKTLCVVFTSIAVMWVPNWMECSDTVPQSCTIFTASFGNTVLFGNNEDYINPSTYYWVSPSTAYSYGGVYFGFDDLVPQGGINEKGLSFDYNGLQEAALNSHPGLPPLRGNPGFVILRECTTVEEAIAMAKRYTWGTSMRYQMHLADATGDAVVISAGLDGELAFERKEKGDGFLVSTNFNLAHYPKDRRRGLCTRYDTAVAMLEMIEDDVTVEYAASILDAVHAEGASVNTLYSNVFDLKKGIIYLYYWHQFDEVITLSVREELAKNTSPTQIKDLFPHVNLEVTLILQSKSLLSTYEELRLNLFSDPGPKEKIENAHMLFSGALSRGEFKDAEEHLHTVHELLETWRSAIHAYVEALGLLPTREVEKISAAFERAKKGYDTVGDDVFSQKCSTYIQALSALGEGIHAYEKGDCKESEEYLLKAKNLFEELGEQEYVDYIQDLTATCKNRRINQVFYVAALFIILTIMVGLVLHERR
jgi:tetratricopeptide (TPR) repeat protein